MTIYTLSEKGDGLEKIYWDRFIKDEFPSYEKFWQKSVAPLTNRPNDIQLKTNPELKKIGKNDHDICIMQLHYTVFTNLVRVYELKQINPLNPDQFMESLTRLCAAVDVADELLERYTLTISYNPWSEEDGQKARREWRKKDNTLQYLRDYRNKMLHGRISPKIIIIGSYERYRVPKFGKEKLYLDWRKVTHASIGAGGKVRNDFDAPNNLLDKAWEDSLQYLEKNWKKYLL